MKIIAFNGDIEVPITGLGATVGKVNIMESFKNFDKIERLDETHLTTCLTVGDPLILSLLDKYAVASKMLPMWFYDDSKGDIKIYIEAEVVDDCISDDINVYMSFPFAETVDRNGKTYEMEFSRVKNKLTDLLKDDKLSLNSYFFSEEEMAQYYTGEFENAVRNGDFEYIETVVEFTESEHNTIKDFFIGTLGQKKNAPQAVLATPRSILPNINQDYCPERAR